MFLKVLTGLMNNSGLISRKAKVDCRPLPVFFPGEDAIFLFSWGAESWLLVPSPSQQLRNACLKARIYIFLEEFRSSRYLFARFFVMEMF